MSQFASQKKRKDWLVSCFENATDMPFSPVFQPRNNMDVILWESHYTTLRLPLCNCVTAKHYKSILQAQMLNTLPPCLSYEHMWLNKFQSSFIITRKPQMSSIVHSQWPEPFCVFLLPGECSIILKMVTRDLVSFKINIASPSATSFLRCVLLISDSYAGFRPVLELLGSTE